MTLSQLRYAIIVADSRSMNQAAQKLFISQPSLSAAIRELEDEVGIEIFRRTNRGIQVTPDGEEFVGYARQVVEQYALIEARDVDKEKEKKKSLRKLLVINGPNLNFLGIREKGIYGTQDYNDLLNMIAQKGLDCHAAISVFQSNHEGAIIDKIQEAYFDKTEGIIINPGAYTHYSYAIRDALASITVPKVEIHISNIMEREDFRKVSVTAPVCDKQIYGHGLNGYLEAIDFVLEKLDEQE